MVAIRLSRYGKKNHPTFRIVVSDKQKDTHGTFLEQLGTYNPHQQPMGLEINVERAKYWLSVGAQPSDTVHNLFVDKGILTSPKRVVAKAKKSDTPAEEPKSETPPAPVEKKEEVPAAETPAT